MEFRSKFEAPVADSATLALIKTGGWRLMRPVTKADKCCQCGTCYLYCPSGSVEDRGTHFSADLNYCKGCGICARLCPISAIIMVREPVAP